MAKKDQRKKSKKELEILPRKEQIKIYEYYKNVFKEKVNKQGNILSINKIFEEIGVSAQITNTEEKLCIKKATKQTLLKRYV